MPPRAISPWNSWLPRPAGSSRASGETASSRGVPPWARLAFTGGDVGAGRGDSAIGVHSWAPGAIGPSFYLNPRTSWVARSCGCFARPRYAPRDLAEPRP